MRSKVNSPQAREDRECFYCHKRGHIVVDCSLLKRKQQLPSKSVGFVKTLKTTVVGDEVEQTYRPFILKGLISFSGNANEQKEITMLRDTGSMQSFVVENNLQFSDATSCSSSVIVHGIEMGCVKVPLHNVHLQSDLCTGFVRVAVCTSLPVKGFHIGK